jgi:hypothetical protein
MTDAAATLSNPPTAPDHWARALGDRQLAVLGELAELGLDVARSIERQAASSSARDAATEVQGMGLAYARVARAIRLTIALQAKRMDELQALDAKAAEVQAEIDDEAEMLSPLSIRRLRVERIVERVVKSECEGESAEAIEDAIDRLMVEAGDRLEDEDIYGDLLERPMSEIVARLCRDLGLSPDWTALAEELWAKDEIEDGSPGEPLAEAVRERRSPSAPDAAPSPGAPLPTPPPAARGRARPEAARPSAHGREAAPPP